MTLAWETKVLREKSVQEPLCPKQIPHKQAQNWTQASLVKSQ